MRVCSRCYEGEMNESGISGFANFVRKLTCPTARVAGHVLAKELLQNKMY